MSEAVNKKRSRAQWAQLMARYEAGSLTRRAFCAQHGLAYSSFCYWRKRLHTRVATSEVSALVELPMLESSEPAWRIELDLGQGVVLRLR